MLLTGLIGLLPGKLACSLTQMLFRNPEFRNYKKLFGEELLS